MTLGRTYELALLTTTLLGLGSVLLGGEMPWASFLALAAPLFSYARGRERPLPLALGTGLGAVGGLAAVAIVWRQGVEALVMAVALFLVGLLCGRLLTRRTFDHDLQAILLSLLLVFAGTIVHTQITYGVVFALFSVAAVIALVSRQLVILAAEDARLKGYGTTGLARRDVVTPTFLAVTSGLALVLLVGTALLFMLFPRFGLGALGLVRRGPRALPANVSLVGLARAGAGSGEVLARVRGVPYAELERGLYLRGPVYEDFVGDGFVESGRLEAVARLPTGALVGGRELSYEVFMQPISAVALLTLGPVKDARIIAGGTANPSAQSFVSRLGFEDGLRAARPLLGPVRYAVTGPVARPGSAKVTPAPVLSAGETARLQRGLEPFLRLPEGLDPRVRRLAAEVVGTAQSPREKAFRLREYLGSNFTYSLDLPNAGKADPLAGFLFEDRRGHCEYFATAFAVLLRAVSVPARVVGGFQGGYWDENGEVVVFTSENAHAWVEWHDDGVGFVVDDATPASEAALRRLSGLAAFVERWRRLWDDYVVEYNLQQQVAMFDRVERVMRGKSVDLSSSLNLKKLGLGAGCLLVVLAAAFFLWQRRGPGRGARGRRASALARQLALSLGKLRGLPVRDGETFREAAASLPGGRAAALIWEAIRLYEAERFNDVHLQAARSRALVKALKAERRRAPAPVERS
ncbi:MAG: DUF3488 domain-containing protein [Deltaproteobacteria bacterium]|nr:DUF3488 domain-containing protein [Deltaproteobacteria bacterium]